MLCFFIDSVFYIENIYTSIYIILIFVANHRIEMTPYFPVIILITNILIAAITNYLQDKNLREACYKINKKPIQKFIFSKKLKLFQTQTWDQLKPGDIIKIKENEEFPADVLILDTISSSFDNHKCYIKGSFVDDLQVPILKLSCEGTVNKTGLKMSTRQFIEQISGIIKFKYSFNN